MKFERKMKLNIFVQILLILGSAAQLQCHDPERFHDTDEGNQNFKFIDADSYFSLIFQDIS